MLSEIDGNGANSSDQGTGGDSDTIQSEIVALRAALAAYTRPPFTGAASIEACRAWDRAHPELAARRVAEIERLNLLLEAEVERARLDRRRRDAAGRLEAAGVPLEALVAAGKPRKTAAIEAVDAWIYGLTTGGRPFLVLLGGVGTGKTVAAAYALRLLVAADGRGRSGLFLRAVEACRVGMFGDDAARVSTWRSAGVLVVDDLGFEVRSSTWAANFDDLLDARTSSKAPTVITSNLTVEGFRERYGERVADRLSARAKVVGLGVGSLRREVRP